MEGTLFLSEFLLVLLVSTVVALVFERIKLPPLLGFLLAGISLGPSGFGLISNTDQVHHLAELGIVLLMLTIGLEFSFARLKGLRNLAVIGGGLQLLISIGVTLAFSWFKSWPLQKGLILGSVIALSSTAIVFKHLLDKGELDTHYGRIAVAILLFQDIAVVPLIIIINSLHAPAETLAQTLLLAGAKALILLIGVALVAKYIIERLMRRIALTKNREIFFLSTTIICLGIAWIGGQLGLSFAIGAFFAGLMFANTEYGTHLMGEIVPFRHLFVSLFFVSIGLLFDFEFARANYLFILGVVGTILLLNFFVTAGIVLGFGYPPRIAMASGLILCQIGEFSFLLLEAGRQTGGVGPFMYQVLLSSALITMFMTPLLFYCIPFILRLSEKQPLFGLSPSNWKNVQDELDDLKNHVILCGFGSTGRDLAFTLQQEKIPFVLIDMNPKLTREARKEKFNVIYGDAANLEVLSRAGIRKAKAIVVSFADPIGMNQIVRLVNHLNSRVHIAVRTRSEKEVASLYDLGADTVIVEEWQADYELHRDILTSYRIIPERITQHLNRLKQGKELIIENAILSQIKND